MSFKEIPYYTKSQYFVIFWMELSKNLWLANIYLIMKRKKGRKHFFVHLVENYSPSNKYSRCQIILTLRDVIMMWHESHETSSKHITNKIGDTKHILMNTSATTERHGKRAYWALNLAFIIRKLSFQEECRKNMNISTHRYHISKRHFP